MGKEGNRRNTYLLRLSSAHPPHKFIQFLIYFIVLFLAEGSRIVHKLFASFLWLIGPVTSPLPTIPLTTLGLVKYLAYYSNLSG